MALSVNTNFAALNAQPDLIGSQNDMETPMKRLTTGLRIKSAQDDAAGLAITHTWNNTIYRQLRRVRSIIKSRPICLPIFILNLDGLATHIIRWRNYR